MGVILHWGSDGNDVVFVLLGVVCSIDARREIMAVWESMHMFGNTCVM